MPDIDIHRVHDLGLRDARSAAERMAEQLRRKFDLKIDWAGNVLKFERPGVNGTLAVAEKDLRLSVSLGFLLKTMKGSIEQAIETELDSLFANPAPRPAPSPRPSPKAEGGAVAK